MTAAVALASHMLTAEEIALIHARRAGLTVAEVEPPIAAAAAPAVPAVEHPFITRMKGLIPAGQTSVYINRKMGHYRPLAVVNTVKGRRGVYCVGPAMNGSGVLMVYTCKITGPGYLHRPGKFDGSFSQPAADLCQFN